MRSFNLERNSVFERKNAAHLGTENVLLSTNHHTFSLKNVCAYPYYTSTVLPTRMKTFWNSLAKDTVGKKVV